MLNLFRRRMLDKGNRRRRRHRHPTSACSIMVGAFPLSFEEDETDASEEQPMMERSSVDSACFSTSPSSSSSNATTSTDNNHLPETEPEVDHEPPCSSSPPLVVSKARIDALKVSSRQRFQDERSKNQWQEEATQNEKRVSAKDVLESLLSDRPQLERILIARPPPIPNKKEEWVTAATDLVLEQVRFRVRWRPNELIPSKDFPNAASSGAWRLCGYTREGCVISNYKLSCWDPSAYIPTQDNNDDAKKMDDDQRLERAVDEYTKYVVYMMELQISKMKASAPQQFVVLFDLKGFRPSLIFRKDVRLMIIKLIYVAQSQYPERLRKTFLLNAPFGFESAWKLIQPLLDEKTASKIHFMKDPSDLVLLGGDTIIDHHVLSTAYGGGHSEYPGTLT